MKKYIFYILLWLPFITFAQTQELNYVKTATYKSPTTTSDHTIAQVNVTYYDGLGRPIQQIEGKASPENTDIITHMEYDIYNRQPKKYLPYVSASGNLLFDISARYNTDQFYRKPKYEYTANPYSQEFYEPSPLNRILKQAAPGNLWEGAQDVYDTNDRTVKFDYQTNGLNEVRRFKVIFQEGSLEYTKLTCTGFYAANQLYKSILKNENWKPEDGKKNTIEEFKDKEGRLILKRNYTKNENETNPDLMYEKYDTYYVYDDFSNLTYVLPPLASDQIVRETTAMPTNGGVNYPWTKLSLVDESLAIKYNEHLSSYENTEILNLHLITEYGGQGGFTILTSEDGVVSLNFNVTTTNPMPYRNGQIADLSGIGNFEDQEIGRISGPDYEYIFLVKNNTITVTGSGDVPSLIHMLQGGEKLNYSKNYPWTAVCKAKASVAEEYNRMIENLPNSEILNVYTPNSYGAKGGLTVGLSTDDNLTVSLNITTDTAMEFNSGALFTLDFERSLPDMTLGTVSGDGYEYLFTVKGNVLHLEGSGSFKQLNFFGSRKIIKKYSIKEEVLNLCYIYQYDKRNRLVEKHIPDNNWTYVIYDNQDRTIMTQNVELREKNVGSNWLFMKYDALGRLIYSGDCRNPNPRAVIQSYFDGLTVPLIESRSTTSFSNGGLSIFYTNNFYPTGNDFVPADGNITAVNYYDDYNFDKNGIAVPIPPNEYNLVPTTATKSLPTGSMVKVLDTAANNWITSVTGYDAKGRTIWAQSKNSYLETNDITESNPDFLGKVTESKTQHIKGSATNLIIRDYFAYDNYQRLLLHSQKIGSGDVKLISWNKYDELGKLDEKKVGGTLPPLRPSYDQYQAYQRINYTSNIRGWLTGINNWTTQDNDLFSFSIDYSGLYNGNISQTSWGMSSENFITRSYTYTYDGLNRLTDAIYRHSTNNAAKYHEKVTYEKNGNILDLQRWGYVGSNTYNIIDQLVYSYKPNSNQLMKVIDLASTSLGFADGTNQGDDYDYYTSGNLKKDLNKGIGKTPDEEIKYNYMNLPTSVIKDTNHHIEFVYTAAGNKIEKKVTDGAGNIKTISYAGKFIYENNSLQYVSHPEGYVEKETNGNFTYIYQYKDHVGNVRLSYKQKPNGLLEVVKANDYYPFGMRHNKDEVVTSSNIAEKRMYNGMEFQDELQINWYDYMARNYDPAIGRWFNTDLLAEKSRRFSPYAYALNNPIYFIDPDGMEATESKVDMTDPNANLTVNEKLDESDFNTMVDIGYGMMRDSRSVGSSVGFSGASSKLNKSGIAKFERAEQKDLENTLRNRFNNSKIDPDGKPKFDQEGLEELHNGVTGLKKAYTEGGSPKVSFIERGDKGDATNVGFVDINKNKIEDNLDLAGTLFHEYRHQWQYREFGGMSHFTYWQGIYGNGVLNGSSGGARARGEVDAYLYQYHVVGDHRYEVIYGIRRYNNQIGKNINSLNHTDKYINQLKK